MKRRFLDCTIFTLGPERRQVSPKFPRHNLIPVAKRYTLIRGKAFLRSYRAFFNLLLKAIRSKKVLLCFVPRANSKMKDILMDIKRTAPNNFFFLSDKWIGGLFSNFRVVRYNVERVFSYNIRSKQRGNYSGLLGFKSIPNFLITLGGKSCDTAIKDAENHSKIESIFTTRSPMDKVTGRKGVNLIVNYSDIRIVYLVLNRLSKFYREIHSTIE